MFGIFKKNKKILSVFDVMVLDIEEVIGRSLTKFERKDFEEMVVVVLQKKAVKELEKIDSILSTKK